MYYEFESRQNMKEMVFDEDGLHIGNDFFPYSEIEGLTIIKTPIFATYGILQFRTGDKEHSVPFPRLYKERLFRALKELERERVSFEGETRTAGGPTGRGEKRPQLDPYEEVKKLKELLDLDIISADEFEKKKKELLNL